MDRHTKWLDPLNRIRDSLKVDNHKKWGLLFYRCDYASDELWAKFLQAARAAIDGSFEDARPHDVDIVRSAFEMTLIEDRATLDGATVDQVRSIFAAWIRSDEAKAESNESESGHWPGFRHPRYTYCVHVDADVLDTVVNRALKLDPELDSYEARQTAYVNLVRLRPEDFPDKISGGASGPPEPGFEEDGGEDWDPDFVNIPFFLIGAGAYDRLYDLSAFWWWAKNRDDNGVVGMKSERNNSVLLECLTGV